MGTDGREASPPYVQRERFRPADVLFDFPTVFGPVWASDIYEFHNQNLPNIKELYLGGISLIPRLYSRLVARTRMRTQKNGLPFPFRGVQSVFLSIGLLQLLP